jgi:hypothetical protein
MNILRAPRTSKLKSFDALSACGRNILCESRVRPFFDGASNSTGIE